MHTAASFESRWTSTYSSEGRDPEPRVFWAEEGPGPGSLKNPDPPEQLLLPGECALLPELGISQTQRRKKMT
jgi:hypothetical protein